MLSEIIFLNNMIFVVWFSNLKHTKEPHIEYLAKYMIGGFVLTVFCSMFFLVCKEISGVHS